MRFRLSLRNYRELFENASDAMWVQDIDGHFVVANKACEKLTGLTNQELVAQNVKEFLSPRSLELAREVGHRLLNGEDFSQPYEQRVIRKDRITRIVKMSSSLVVVDGRPVGFQHVARDVTEEHSVAEMLTRITNGSPIPTFVVDRQHKITHWNIAMEALTGRDEAQMMGTDNHWQPVYPAKRATLADLIVEGAPADDIEFYYRGKYKKSKLIEGAFETEDFFPTLGAVGKWLHITASPIKSDGSEIIGAIETLQDVTEEKQLQENMRYYVQLITRAQEEERKRLARELHDDLSSSLLLLIHRLDSSIPSGRAKHALVLKESLGSLRDQAVEALEHVRRYVQDLRPRILDDLGLIASLEWMADDMQKNHGIRTTVEVAGIERALPADVQLLLFRIGQEALTNIRRHAGASLAAIRLDLDDEAITMTVTDNGHGFSVPTRIEDLASAGRLGIMGMAERARLLNGTLEVGSTPGEGTRVVTRLPV
ncbi:MAG: hypothetical protein A2147_06270 [Chloroflexi bacterium RBG_16_57_8]|nr:MAG: hypothetical protein A2147_06270 [Chloroflexi bacterium RBG_16_57_8]